MVSSRCLVAEMPGLIHHFAASLFKLTMFTKARYRYSWELNSDEDEYKEVFNNKLKYIKQL